MLLHRPAANRENERDFGIGLSLNHGADSPGVSLRRTSSAMDVFQSLSAFVLVFRERLAMSLEYSVLTLQQTNQALRAVI